MKYTNIKNILLPWKAPLFLTKIKKKQVKNLPGKYNLNLSTSLWHLYKHSIL